MPQDEVDRPDRGKVRVPVAQNIIFRDIPSGLEVIKYNPYRDVAYTHRSIIATGLARVTSPERWPAMAWLLRQHKIPWWKRGLQWVGVKFTDSADPIRSYDMEVIGRLMDLASYYKQCPQFHHALEDSGFLDLPANKQMALMAGIGSAYLVQAWNGRRDLDNTGEPSSNAVLTMEQIIDQVTELHAHYEAHRSIKRRLVRWLLSLLHPKT